jgi:hypothetical protein
MATEQNQETPAAQAAYFRIRVNRLIEAGALDPSEADAAFAGFLERAAKRKEARS